MKDISKKELESIEALMYEEAKKKPNLLFLDIRDLSSYQQDHLPEALHGSPEKLHELFARKGYKKEILVICHHGVSSRYCAALLKRKGYIAHSLQGGMVSIKR